MKNIWKIRIGKHNLGDITFHTVNGIVMIFIAIIMIYPFWNTVAVSFNDAQDTLRGGIHDCICIVPEGTDREKIYHGVFSCDYVYFGGPDPHLLPD